MKSASITLIFSLILLLSCQRSNNEGLARTVNPADGPQISSDGSGLTSQSCDFVTTPWGDKGTTPIRAEKVVSGLEVPWSIGFLPSGSMLITERPGRLRLFRDGSLIPQPLLTLAVGNRVEGGLLGLAVHPEFSTNRFFYVYYTAHKGRTSVNRVERYRLSEDELTATADKMILDDIPAGTFHDGGRLRIGPDKMLYIGTGDARVEARSQDLQSTAGKILRLTLDGNVPTDNPAANSPVFISGVRNIQGFDWYRKKALIVSDHGPSGELNRRGGDEISLAHAGSNLGWPTIWKCETQSPFVTPLIAWEKAMPPGGLAIYTGQEIPEWQGSIIVGTLGSQHLHRLVLEETAGVIRVSKHESYFEGNETLGRLREVVMGPDRHLYVTTSNCDGNVECPTDKDMIFRIRKAQ